MPSAFDFLDFRACLQSVTSDEETTADGVASDVNCAEEAVSTQPFPDYAFMSLIHRRTLALAVTRATAVVEDTSLA